jgi:hypothetical protein
MSNENKQTAVDWLFTMLNNPNRDQKFANKLLQKAKEMEKEQIVNTWSEATAPQHEIGLSDASYVIDQIKKAEQYYEQTYGGGNK